MSWFDLFLLGAESQQVVWLRLLKLGAGGLAARREAELMMSEKIIAAARATEQLLRGASSEKVVADYRRKVRANARRLSR